jgi:hypothetical protein
LQIVRQFGQAHFGAAVAQMQENAHSFLERLAGTGRLAIAGVGLFDSNGARRQSCVSPRQ